MAAMKDTQDDMPILEQLHQVEQDHSLKSHLDKVDDVKMKSTCGLFITCLDILDGYDRQVCHYSQEAKHNEQTLLKILSIFSSKEAQQALQLDDAIKALGETPDFAVLDHGRMAILLRITLMELNSSILHLLEQIASIPEWIIFWKTQKRRYVYYKLELGPFEWIKPRQHRISLNERIRALSHTLEMHLEKIGLLKQLSMEIQRLSLDTPSRLDIQALINQSFDTMSATYDTQNLLQIIPRKGWNLPQTSLPGTNDRLESHSTSTIESDRKKIDCERRDAIHVSIHLLMKKIKVLAAARDQYNHSLALALKGCVPPSKFRQKWLTLTLLSFGACLGLVYTHRNRSQLKTFWTNALVSVRDFFTEHMVEPVLAIIDEVVLNKKPEIQDPAALVDTKLSLQRMIAQFLHDTKPANLTKDECLASAQRMDMSVVSVQLEKELPRAMRNIVSGDIVRMLLIQVQFIKKELMMAMGSIDDLMYKNQLSLQMMATVPAFLLFAAAYQGLVALSREIVSLTSKQFCQPMLVQRQMRDTLRDIERLLNMQQRGERTKHTVFRPQLAKEDRKSDDVQSVLTCRDLGYLLVLLHRLHELFDRNRNLFDEGEQVRFEEDLSDLVDETLLCEQLATINRMYHSHRFLLPTSIIYPSASMFF